jgi:Ca2+/H+ antiporter, TMEM165/GDT1 family
MLAPALHVTSVSVSADTAGLVVSVFLASAVEFVEALTIVLAMGVTRGWRSALAGVGGAVAALAAITVVAGYALAEWFPEALLQLIVGTLLLIFGLQWLRKAVLRAAGLKAQRDEDEAYREEVEAGRGAGADTRLGLDWFGFVVSFKGVFLEGLEIVFIVITFGLNAHDVGAAAAGAAIAGALVLTAGALAHRPLASVPQNTIKFAVGLLLSTFGTFWAIEGLGVFAAGRESLEWPGGDAALPVLLAVWAAFAWSAIRLLRRGVRAAVV